METESTETKASSSIVSEACQEAPQLQAEDKTGQEHSGPLTHEADTIMEENQPACDLVTGRA